MLAIRATSIMILCLFLMPLMSASDVSAEDYSIGWNDSVLIDSENLGNAETPYVAMDDQGNGLAVWHQSDGSSYNIWANRYDAMTGWQGAEIIDASDYPAYQPRVAMDPAGNAVVVWSQTDELSNLDVMARSYTAEKGWGEIILIEKDPAYRSGDPFVAMDRYGHAIIVWSLYDWTRHNIYASVLQGDSSWSEPMLVENNNTHSAEAPQACFDARGNAIILWTQDISGSDGAVWSRIYNFESGWNSAKIIASNLWYPSFSFAVMPDGDASCAIETWNLATSQYEVYASNYIADSGWTAPVTLYKTSYASAESPSVGIDATGRTLVVWTLRSATSSRIAYNIYSKDTGWIPYQLIDYIMGDCEAYRPVVAMNPYGYALVVFGAQFQYLPASLWGATFDFDNQWTSLERISDDSLYYSSYWQVAMSYSGSGLTVFIQGGAKYLDVWGSSYTPEDTTPPSLTITTPSSGAVLSSSSVTVTGTTEPGASLVVNGYVVFVESDGSYSFVLPLLDGVNVITAIATDPAGNQASTSVSVTFEDPVDDIIDGLIASLDDLGTQLDTIRDDLNQTSADLEGAIMTIDQLSSDLESVVISLDTLSDQIADLEDGLDPTTYDISELEQALSDTISQLTLVSEQLNQTIAQVEQLSSDLNQTNDDLADDSNEIDGIQDSLDGIESNTDGMASQTLVILSVLGVAVALLALMSIMYMDLRRKLNTNIGEGQEDSGSPPPPEQ